MRGGYDAQVKTFDVSLKFTLFCGHKGGNRWL